MFMLLIDFFLYISDKSQVLYWPCHFKRILQISPQIHDTLILYFNCGKFLLLTSMYNQLLGPPQSCSPPVSSLSSALSEEMPKTLVGSVERWGSKFPAVTERRQRPAAKQPSQGGGAPGGAAISERGFPSESLAVLGRMYSGVLFSFFNFKKVCVFSFLLF